MHPSGVLARPISMAIALLYRLAAGDLPRVLEDSKDIEDAQILVMGGHLRASFDAPERDGSGIVRPGAATAHALTPLARRFLRMFPSDTGANGD